MRQTAELGLRRAGQGDARHPGDLGRDGVHDDGADQRRQAARHVQADPLHRHDAPLDRRAAGDVGHEAVLELGLGGRAQASDGLLERRADAGVEAGQGGSQLAGRARAAGRGARRRTAPPRRAPRRCRARARPRRSGGRPRARARRRARHAARRRRRPSRPRRRRGQRTKIESSHHAGKSTDALLAACPLAPDAAGSSRSRRESSRPWWDSRRRSPSRWPVRAVGAPSPRPPVDCWPDARLRPADLALALVHRVPVPSWSTPRAARVHRGRRRRRQPRSAPSSSPALIALIGAIPCAGRVVARIPPRSRRR